MNQQTVIESLAGQIARQAVAIAHLEAENAALRQQLAEATKTDTKEN